MSLALVTGGTGFIGSHLARELCESGYKVRVLDDLSNSELISFLDLDCEFVQGDVRDSALIEKLTRGAQWVFHLAAMVSVPGSMDQPVECYQINLEGTLSVLRAANKAGTERVVLASSAAIYGESEDPVEEDAQKQPLSPYAASKLAMEEAALMYHRVYDMPTVSLRYFNVYGPRQQSQLYF